LAEPTFDRARFADRLATRALGRRLIARAAVESTNDVAWDAAAETGVDGLTVVADDQTRGRGRLGRAWVQAPGKGLALSVVMLQGCDRRQLGVLPLTAGLALAEALERLGAAPALKWPNDVLLGGRKVAGILCESRRLPDLGDAAVIGVGVNVSQQADDFPPELRATATSLAIAGVSATREDVAAAFLSALEPRWAEVQEGSREAVLQAWQARAAWIGSPVTVRTPDGEVSGVARGLDRDGALVVTLDDGRDTTVLAGDVAPR
jgi:BirA family biotin operon repressor/biotin-[acetyl-CoA-carboxylase] ligase